MKYLFSILLITLSVTGEISCNCGCLKCSKHLQVVSPPYLPFQVIVNGKPPCASDFDSPHVSPLIVPPALNEDYQLAAYQPLCQPLAYRYKLQAPLPPAPPLLPPLVGLKARADRVVLQRPNCPVYTGDDDDCSDAYRPACKSILYEGARYGTAAAPPRLPPPTAIQIPKSGPILESIGTAFFAPGGCGCRYDHPRRKKREIPVIRKSVTFLMGLLPHFIRFPIEQTFKSFKTQPKFVAVVPKPSKTFLQKLQKLNRDKRSVVFTDDQISLPFLRVTDIENELEDEEEDDEESEEVVGGKNPREEFLQPLNFDHILPHNPIYYLLNAPIRFLHQFHKFGQQISPVFKSVPHVFVNSKKYLRDFGRHLKNDVLSFASELIGDFDELDAHSYRYIKPRRYKRSLEQYQPEYSLVFGNQTDEQSRRKRYILKVVDEDEVEKFLRDKLGDFAEQTTRRPKKKKERETNKRKLVVERLSSKVIVDNNGRPFIEIDGVKRPLFRAKNKEEEEKHEEPEKKEEEEDVKEKINSIITEAKERINQNSAPSLQPSVPNQIIKERINQILTEIQDLINLDFDKYSTIHSDLCKLDNFKKLLLKDWKKILMEERSNDISSKIRLLDDFKEMQILRDKAVEDIASVLSSGSSFMTKKLIKMLVRLQKLQCLIYRVVEDFGERIKMGTDFDVRKEIKYVDFLTSLHFVAGQSKHELENNLKNERDAALENEMTVLDALRKLLEDNKDNPQKLYEEAQLLWEFKNIDKLQKDTIGEMNGKISRGQKVRKELKILFDLLKQQENCEEKQKKLLTDVVPHHKGRRHYEESEEEEEEIKPKFEERHGEVGRTLFNNNIMKSRTFQRKPVIHNIIRNRNFPHKTIIEDKQPVKLVSNGYTMTAYKVSDGFD